MKLEAIENNKLNKSSNTYRLITKSILLMLIAILYSQYTVAQSHTVGDFIVDETELYAMTKQMSQFFSRFNNEEDQFGKKLHPSSEDYRNNQKRKQILPHLFDKENQRTAGTLKDFFIEDLTADTASNFMEFLGGRWYAEVSATFNYLGKDVNILLILMIEKEGLGSKWVLTNIYFPTFNKMFPVGDIAEKEKHFLHPMSHELDFMNIHKAFQTPDVIEYYGSNSFQPDYLSLFFFEIKHGRLKFVKIDDLKFHIFQIRNWYFEISWFNRKGTNSGWLISNLMYIDENDKKPLLKFYQP